MLIIGATHLAITPLDVLKVNMQQPPGEAEEELARVHTALVIKKFLTSRNPGLLCVPKDVGFGVTPIPISLFPLGCKTTSIIMPPGMKHDAGLAVE
ncbi:hypothetical protein L2E82_51433 [Cichorium intybus]|nr:hypothetical protein L2E82_51433 [Cichorium intybus]